MNLSEFLTIFILAILFLTVFKYIYSARQLKKRLTPDNIDKQIKAYEIKSSEIVQQIDQLNNQVQSLDNSVDRKDIRKKKKLGKQIANLQEILQETEEAKDQFTEIATAQQDNKKLTSEQLKILKNYFDNHQK